MGRAEADSGGVAPDDPGPPPDARLDAAERCFSAGDFSQARSLATQALGAESPEVRAAARGLLDRLAADPAALWMALGCIALFAIVVWVTLLR